MTSPPTYGEAAPRRDRPTSTEQATTALPRSIPAGGVPELDDLRPGPLAARGLQRAGHLAARAGEFADDPFADGYRLGYLSGVEDGRAAAEWELWRGKAAWLSGRPVGVGPSHLELLARRCECHPGDCRCLDCQRYIAKLTGRQVAA
jgi:hypothetical protein